MYTLEVECRHSALSDRLHLTTYMCLSCDKSNRIQARVTKFGRLVMILMWMIFDPKCERSKVKGHMARTCECLSQCTLSVFTRWALIMETLLWMRVDVYEYMGLGYGMTLTHYRHYAERYEITRGLWLDCNLPSSSTAVTELCSKQLTRT